MLNLTLSNTVFQHEGKKHISSSIMVNRDGFSISCVMHPRHATSEDELFDHAMDTACMAINVSHLLMALGEEVTVHDDLKSSITAAAAIRKAYAA
jgi:hypothetical protein